MFFNTMKFIIVSIIFVFLIGGIVYLGLSPFNKMVFFTTGTLNNYFKNAAETEINKIENTSAIKSPLLNATIEEDELEQKLIETRKNEEKFWIIYSIVAFAFIILFYTAWTEIKKQGG